MMESLYEENEYTNVRFVGLLSENSRYDFCIVSTHQFFGKPLIICMQTGRSALLSSEDAGNIPYIKQVFQVADDDEAENLSSYFQSVLPAMPLVEQYSD